MLMRVKLVCVLLVILSFLYVSPILSVQQSSDLQVEFGYQDDFKNIIESDETIDWDEDIPINFYIYFNDSSVSFQNFGINMSYYYNNWTRVEQISDSRFTFGIYSMDTPRTYNNISYHRVIGSFGEIVTVTGHLKSANFHHLSEFCMTLSRNEVLYLNVSVWAKIGSDYQANYSFGPISVSCYPKISSMNSSTTETSRSSTTDDRPPTTSFEFNLFFLTVIFYISYKRKIEK